MKGSDKKNNGRERSKKQCAESSSSSCPSTCETDSIADVPIKDIKNSALKVPSLIYRRSKDAHKKEHKEWLELN